MDVKLMQPLPQPPAPQEGTVTRVGAAQGNPGMAKLQKAAQDFEAIMINSLWSSMKDGSLGSDDDLESDSTDSPLEQYGMQMVSGALAKSGGVGVGKMIVNALQSKVEGGPNTNEI